MCSVYHDGVESHEEHGRVLLRGQLLSENAPGQICYVPQQPDGQEDLRGEAVKGLLHTT